MNKPRHAASAPRPLDFTALDTALAATAAEIDAALDGLLPRPSGSHGRVQEAMRYAVFAGGKRLRPFLVRASAGLFGISGAGAMRAGAAVEVLHTYSLSQLVSGLAKAAGSEGMVGGQMMDMLAPDESFDSNAVMLLQRLKTGALFEFACEAGAILGEAGAEARAMMRDYARDFGLTFQITDDLIDTVSSAGAAGKSVGKDEAQGKATLVSIFGVEGARAKAAELAARAAGRLEGFGAAAGLLRALPYRLLDRDR